MNKSQRVWLNPDDPNNNKYLYVKLEQEIDTLEVMSLKIDTKEAYQDFNADYGVIVGRVTANNGVTVPNAKVSIFIPLDEEDENNGDIVSIYPYKKPTDKNNDGKRYNLLPRVSQINPETDEIKPNQSFGSFPTKEEILTNPTYLEVYKKYYKYTTVTNNSGDYMIYGVPIGTQTVHVSVDITDIGKYSMTPAAMVTNLGYSPNFFKDNNTKIKESSDLTDLPHIETQEISVDVIPFWGDSQNFDIGITRTDFRIRAALQNVFYLFGSAFTDGDDEMWGDNFYNEERINELYRTKNGYQTLSISTKRIGTVMEKIYYYPPEFTDEEINSGEVDPSEMLVLDPSQYSVFKRDGDFIFIVNCNRRRVITDEAGIEQVIDPNSSEGVFTEFRGFVTLELSENEPSMDFNSDFGDNTKLEPFRFKLKFPQFDGDGQYFDKPNSSGTETAATMAWRTQHKLFKAGKFYSFAKFNPVVRNLAGNGAQFPTTHGFFNWVWEYGLNDPYNKDPFWVVGSIVTETVSDSDNNIFPNNEYHFPSNSETDTQLGIFGANWLNLSIYFPQLGYVTSGGDEINDVQNVDLFHAQRLNILDYNRYYTQGTAAEEQQIAAGQYNTKFFARNDLHWTDIIEVPENDIRKMREANKGLTNLDINNLSGDNYRNGENIPSDWVMDKPCPYNGGKLDGDADSSSADTRTYFYKGFDTADCVQYLFELGIITG